MGTDGFELCVRKSLIRAHPRNPWLKQLGPLKMWKNLDAIPDGTVLVPGT